VEASMFQGDFVFEDEVKQPAVNNRVAEMEVK
jgi:hypothetical protein